MGELTTPRSRAVKISEQCRVVLWTESTGTIFWASTSRRGVFIAGHQSSLASLTKTPTKDPIEGLFVDGWCLCDPLRILYIYIYLISISIIRRVCFQI